MTVTAIIATYNGTPEPEQAYRLIWEASCVLSGRRTVRFMDLTRELSQKWLLFLTHHHNDRVSREARKACIRFGITSKVAVGFTMGDSA